MTGVALWQMITDLADHSDLSDEDRTILNPAFEAIKRHEVVSLPELIISHVQRLHAELVPFKQN